MAQFPGVSPPPRRGPLIAASVEPTRERILRVAAETFAKNGFHATGVAELGRAAGLKRGALYYHIKSKEELLYDLSRRHVEEALTRGRRVAAAPLPPVEKFRELARVHVDVVTSRQAEVTVVLREMHALSGERATKLRRLRAEYEDLFFRILMAATDAGARGSPRTATSLAILGMYNSVHVWYSSRLGLSPRELADRLSDVVLRGVCPAPSEGTPDGVPTALGTDIANVRSAE